MTFYSDIDYASAFLPDKWIICGVELNDFSRGHKFLLKRIGSTFVIGGDITVTDLVLAVLICQRDFKAGSKFAFGKFGILARIFTYAIAIRSSMSRKYLVDNVQAFMRYMEQAEKPPKGIFRNPDSAVTYAPETLVSICDLCSHYGYSVDEFLNLPMRRTIIERYKLLETDKIIEWRAPWMGAPKEKGENVVE